MIANYHTHTWRCNHAEGCEERYVTTAIEQGFQILGFSDHTPYCFPEWYHSGFRMRMDQLPGYITVVQNLQKKYQDKIEIHLGLETEFYPDYFPELMKIIQDTPIEYMILGQHYVGNEIDDWYSGLATEDESILIRYCDQVIEAMETGLFTYLAHPDLINFVGDDSVYEKQMRRVCQAANACNLPVEFNLLGLAEHRHYPDSRFWSVAAEEGCKAVLACDAHQADALADPRTERKARVKAEKYGIPILETVELRNIHQ